METLALSNFLKNINQDQSASPGVQDSPKEVLPSSSMSPQVDLELAAELHCAGPHFCSSEDPSPAHDSFATSLSSMVLQMHLLQKDFLLN